ncbi:uncharacterized protein ACA1_382330 [Acanthamoeba castellanii str. Neff]|uniref:Mitochondrial pyruvate carrier n=1 Tax=Acanthamoeba castellanii (strain ATCC 30010 / Neff) TaxID=1257118 RepID=L8GUA1_ACACF|nr:uncharacterized protein ACA1_382330 [Acanthamoeba castellanii str. Neff]ELR16764.1 hypothetical protein ACA1_382330 [Acanthamoeba castellanii str. Neff]
MSGSAWTKLEQRFFAKYHGVEGGVLLKGPFWQNLAQKYPVFGKVNNGLAIVPLYGILEGKPAVKDLDLNQSLALSLTGLVWTYYGFLVVPRADLLIAVNVALLSVNGYNVYRKINYDKQMQAAQAHA